MVDHVTGLTAIVGLLAALLHARSTGEGCDVDTCLFDAALHQLGYAAIWYLNEGYVPPRQPRSAHFSLAPVQTLPTSDNRHVRGGAVQRGSTTVPQRVADRIPAATLLTLSVKGGGKLRQSPPKVADSTRVRAAKQPTGTGKDPLWASLFRARAVSRSARIRAGATY